MRFLVDQCVAPEISRILADNGNDSVHTSDIGLREATDTELFEICRLQNRVLLTADRKLGKYIAEQRASTPSVVIIRGYHRDIEATADLAALIPIITQVQTGGDDAIFTLRPNKPTRVRILPLVT